MGITPSIFPTYVATLFVATTTAEALTPAELSAASRTRKINHIRTISQMLSHPRLEGIHTLRVQDLAENIYITYPLRVTKEALAIMLCEWTHKTSTFQIPSSGAHTHPINIGSAGSHEHTLSGSSDYEGGTEARMRNIAMMAIIKY